ncbi:MAG: DcaP family trimeric outer membrane transporter [Rikenellaceae bacterium]
MKKFLLLMALMMMIGAKGYCVDIVKGNTSVSIGGFVTLTMGLYVEGATTSGNDFPVSNINMDPAQGDEHRLVFDPTSTRLSIGVTQATDALGDVKLYIEGDFRGSGNTLFLRCATIDIKGFTVGQTWSLMTDSKSLATTIDISGANSRTFFRTQMVAYRYKFDKKYTLGASLEYPTFKTIGVTMPEVRIPDVVAYVDKSGKLGYVKIGGVLRTIQYCEGDDVKSVNGWGVRLSGSLNVTPKFTLSAQGMYGVGVSKYITDLANLSYDVIEDSDGTIYNNTPMYGVMCSAKYKFNDKFSLGANYSKAFVDIDSSYSAIDNTYKTGQYISTTLFYTPVKSLILGAEYLNGVRNNYGGLSERAQRINTMVRYLF